VSDVTTCDDFQSARPGLWRTIKPSVLRTLRMATAILVGFAALFLKLEYGHSARGNGNAAALLRSSDARSTAPLHKTDHGRLQVGIR
jgi:hypothetical protein